MQDPVATPLQRKDPVAAPPPMRLTCNAADRLAAVRARVPSLAALVPLVAVAAAIAARTLAAVLLAAPVAPIRRIVHLATCLKRGPPTNQNCQAGTRKQIPEDTHTVLTVASACIRWDGRCSAQAPRPNNTSRCRLSARAWTTGRKGLPCPPGGSRVGTARLACGPAGRRLPRPARPRRRGCRGARLLSRAVGCWLACSQCAPTWPRSRTCWLQTQNSIGKGAVDWRPGRVQGQPYQKPMQVSLSPKLRASDS